MIMREQDRTLDSITGTLTTLTEQAGLMGREVNEHNECVSRTQGKALLIRGV
jgi:syntaxin 6